MAEEDAPATKKDIQALDGRLEALEERLKASEERLSEQMRDMQTELLKAFLPWQDQVRIQFRELEANTGNSVQAVKLRMDIMERRLGEIEKRLLLNPPAA
jgi:polyhydroxyalkanoate synthesis regulator phasin